MTRKEKFLCYSAGPGLFPRDLSDGRRESWEEAQMRVRKTNEAISRHTRFKVITPSNAGLDYWPEEKRSRACMLTDLIYATRSDIVFADVTPFGGREPDSGTVVEAVACALSGGLLVLWANPLTTFAEKYRDAEVHPDSELDLHYNLMLEQLYYQSWKMHFGFSVPVFDGLESAAACTEEQIVQYGLERVTNFLLTLDNTATTSVIEDVKKLL